MTLWVEKFWIWQGLAKTTMDSTGLAFCEQLREWVFDAFLVNVGGPFGAVMADPGPSRPCQTALEGFSDLDRPHESSGAHLGTSFRSFSGEMPSSESEFLIQ